MIKHLLLVTLIFFIILKIYFAKYVCIYLYVYIFSIFWKFEFFVNKKYLPLSSIQECDSISSCFLIPIQNLDQKPCLLKTINRQMQEIKHFFTLNLLAIYLS